MGRADVAFSARMLSDGVIVSPSRIARMQVEIRSDQMHSCRAGVLVDPASSPMNVRGSHADGEYPAAEWGGWVASVLRDHGRRHHRQARDAMLHLAGWDATQRNATQRMASQDGVLPPLRCVEAIRSRTSALSPTNKECPKWMKWMTNARARTYACTHAGRRIHACTIISHRDLPR